MTVCNALRKRCTDERLLLVLAALHTNTAGNSLMNAISSCKGRSDVVSTHSYCIYNIQRLSSSLLPNKSLQDGIRQTRRHREAYCSISRPPSSQAHGQKVSTIQVPSISRHVSLQNRADLHDIPYASRYDVQMDLPRYKMPSSGVDAKVVYQLLHDELELGEFGVQGM